VLTSYKQRQIIGKVISNDKLLARTKDRRGQKIGFDKIYAAIKYLRQQNKGAFKTIGRGSNGERSSKSLIQSTVVKCCSKAL
jgi:hypothetical protein